MIELSRGSDHVGEGPRTTMADDAYRQIKDDVIRCVLPPGGRVTEAQLCQRCALGHSPIRAALQRLQTEGLLVSEARHGWRVGPLRPKDILDSSEVRLLLEPEAAYRAAGKIPPAVGERLKTLCGVEYDPSDPESLAAYLRSNTQLHSLVAEASGNRRLARIVTSLLRHDERLFHFGFRLANYGAEVAHQHHTLVDALLSGDGETARDTTREQILDTRRVIMRSLMSAASLPLGDLVDSWRGEEPELALTRLGAEQPMDGGDAAEVARPSRPSRRGRRNDKANTARGTTV
ncbi:MAG: GntR family transcriptional regulator [Candidatus Dormibacteria bacterium]